MSDTDLDVDRLRDLLDTIPPEREGRSVAELDGIVATRSGCPDTIMPSEWLAGIWGEDNAFKDMSEAEATRPHLYPRLSGTSEPPCAAPPRYRVKIIWAACCA